MKSVRIKICMLPERRYLSEKYFFYTKVSNQPIFIPLFNAIYQSTQTLSDYRIK